MVDNAMPDKYMLVITIMPGARKAGLMVKKGNDLFHRGDAPAKKVSSAIKKIAAAKNEREFFDIICALGLENPAYH